MDIPSDHSLAYLEELYEQYLNEPGSLTQKWQDYFNELPRDGRLWERRSLGTSLPSHSVFNPPGGDGNGVSSLPAAAGLSRDEIAEVAASQDRIDQLVRAYRVRGHLKADLDPLNIPRPDVRELQHDFYGFDDGDMEKSFSFSSVSGAGHVGSSRTLREVISHLEKTYCRSIGVQFMHIDDLEVKNWLQDRMEGSGNSLELSQPQQVRILTKLTDAVLFEEFIQKKYLGAKSFSLEGAESLIPLLDLMIERGGSQGLNEIVVGMAHRGRLNVLANIMGKSLRDIFREFEDAEAERYVGRGDVKYHMGYSSDVTTEAGQRIHLSLCFNPSHLEFVNTVVTGRIRAKQDLAGDTDRKTKLGLLIHGDAAFAGEGIVQETLNMSELQGYHTGGTIHVIVNNQIGFTTNPSDSRSSTYATDVAKMLQIPIFHVNGEDPEAVAQVVSLAMDFRQQFQKDVVIDLYAFRRRGHNEGDEPSFTQPLMYEVIRKRETVRESYVNRLLKLDTVTKEEADEIAENRRLVMEDELNVARKSFVSKPTITLQGKWIGYYGGADRPENDEPTNVDKNKLAELVKKLTNVPEGFEPHRKISRFMSQRAQMASGERLFDWGGAESAAYATLLVEKKPIRVTGQDVQRGTFSHRHAVIHDVKTGQTHCPLSFLSDDQAGIEIYNSPLCEAGVLAFEYGYSLDVPEGLTIWEAQFGDFANCAQVIFDQFIVSAEEKWKRLSGLVVQLPHGFEGQGPEHSSARLERYLQMAANDNVQITAPTTPAQIFHQLRRQVIRSWRKPLITMSPKSLLRHPRAVSTLEELADGGFQKVIPDSEVTGGDVKRVLVCSGKVYYDLLAYRETLANADKFPIIRVEQLYPMPKAELDEALSKYAADTPVFWVQEEPENMGPWRFVFMTLRGELTEKYPLDVVCRPAAASPATGSKASHELETQRLLENAFGDGAVVK